MGYIPIHQKIDFVNKGHDFNNCSVQGNTAYGVVCDGVSSSFESAYGAERSCAMAMKEFTNSLQSTNEKIDYQLLYKKISSELSQNASPLGFLDNEVKSVHATTIITALIRPSLVEFSYCGNGAIMEIRPEWFNLPANIPMPWGINNYLNPHSRFVDGDTKLYRVLKASNDNQSCDPQIVSLEGSALQNSYFLICSDGLYSSDEISTAWNEDNSVYYIQESARLIQFLKVLREHHEENWTNRGSFTENFRSAILQNNILIDDLSYVLFVPEP